MVRVTELDGRMWEKMKKIFTVCLVVLMMGCASGNKYGKCIGLNGKEKPTLEYEYSTWNVVWGIIGFELLIPPVIVLMNELKCPVGPKP